MTVPYYHNTYLTYPGGQFLWFPKIRNWTFVVTFFLGKSGRHNCIFGFGSISWFCLWFLYPRSLASFHVRNTMEPITLEVSFSFFSNGLFRHLILPSIPPFFLLTCRSFKTVHKQSVVVAIAMEAEASPFVQHLGLEPDESFFSKSLPFQAFRGKHQQCDVTVITNGKDQVHGEFFSWSSVFSWQYDEIIECVVLHLALGVGLNGRWTDLPLSLVCIHVKYYSKQSANQMNINNHIFLSQPSKCRNWRRQLRDSTSSTRNLPSSRKTRRSSGSSHQCRDLRRLLLQGSRNWRCLPHHSRCQPWSSHTHTQFHNLWHWADCERRRF